MKRRASIFRYGLYGEALSAHDPEFVHIEDISARSALYEWRIRPHTHEGMFQVIVLEKGSARLWLDDAARDARAPCAVVIPAGVVHGFHFEPDTAGHVVTAAEELLSAVADRSLRERFQSLPLAAFTLDFEADPQAFARVGAVLGELQAEFQWPQRGRNAMLEWLLHALLLLVWRRQDCVQTQSQARAGRHETFSRFQQLVEDHHAQHWDIGAYARELSVTQATLNRLCRQFAGKGALEIIQERLVIAARRHLVYTDATVEAIAYGLGFRDPAYFSRFFKRRTSQTPGGFRAARHAAA